MMVDDEMIMIEVVKVYLEGEGYHDFVVTDQSSQALEMMQKKIPDVLLLDLSMPEVSGFDIMQAMQQNPDLKHIPVIVLTSSTDSDTKLRALELGATDFLAKPVDASELILRLRNTLTVKAYLDQLTFYDPLTGLPNRNLFAKLLGWAIQSSGTNERQLAVLHISTGNLKKIDISLGHGAIDKLQLSICERLSGSLGLSMSVTDKSKRDVWKNLGYLGEGQYVAFLEGIEHAESVADVASSLLNDLDGNISVDGHNVSVSTSIGISICPDDATDVDTLLTSSGAAAEVARSNPGDKLQFFSSEISARSIERLRLESQLKSAIEKEEFFLEYQPIVDGKTHELVSVEALIRWNHPDHAIRYPGAFIDLAEQSGLIVPIGTWVIGEACRQIRRWHDMGFDSIEVHVNVSAEQFKAGNLISVLSAALNVADISPECLTVELTESGVMSDVEESILLMQQIKSLGVKLSIDDFGTGYSSLSYLKRFPVDQLKIDAAFIREVHKNHQDEVIVRTIISLAHGLSLDVVAEGIESEAQATLLTKLQCSKFQGFLFSKPIAGDRIPGFMGK